MSAIAERFRAFQAQKRCGFIPFIVAGDPDLETTAELLIALSRLEPVAIELGVPFSDPTADGPVIQRAADRALAKGTTLRRVLGMISDTQRKRLAPLVLFTYYNPILQFGIEAFSRAAADCELAGVLVVDLPAEAAGPLRSALRRRNIDLIFLVAPTTSTKRLTQTAEGASGFIYAVSRAGVTGSSSGLVDESKQLVSRIRRASDLPVAVGFGIKSSAQAQRVCEYADAVVVGSHLVAEIERIASRDVSTRGGIVAHVVRCAQRFTALR